MTKIFIEAVAYATTGVGMYHVFFVHANLYSYLIFAMGLTGVLYSAFDKKLHGA